MGSSHFLHSLLIAFIAFASAIRAGGGPYYYTGAQWAVQAQCPANYPNSCNSISQGNYCCPSGQYCTWADAKVACCPDNCQCSGWSSGDYGYHSSWRPHSSYHAPQSTWEPAHTSYRPQPYCHECEQTTTVVYAPQSYHHSSQPAAYQGYCRTQYAYGPGLPTSRQGDCGLILIESPPPNAGVKIAGAGLGMWVLVWVLGLQVLGGMVLVWR